jgi:hypothetical protein
VKIDEFLAAYRRRHDGRLEPPALSPPDSPLGAASDRAFAVAEWWGDLLHDGLSGAAIPAFADYARFLDRGYAPWADRLFGDVVEGATRMRVLADGPGDGAGTHAAWPGGAKLDRSVRALDRMLTRSRFHLLQRFSQASWLLAFYPRGIVVRPAWIRKVDLRARVSIGIQAVHLAEAKQSVQRLEGAGVASARALRQTLNGALAELDAAVALWEVLLRGAGDRVTVMPAPPQFEQLAGRANIDYAVVDVTRGRAIGIQVKSTVHGAGDDGYDAERVLLLHAAEDLGSFHVEAVGDRPGAGTRVPRPGSLALRYLSIARYHEEMDGQLTLSGFEDYKRRADALLPATMTDAGRRAHELVAAAARAAHATAERPARTPTAQERIRLAKQSERARFERTVDAVHGRVVAALHR